MSIRPTGWLVLCATFAFSACGEHLFGPDKKPLAAGLELSPTERADLCAIFPYSIAVDQIGWQKPFILWHAATFNGPWDVYDSSTGEHRHVSDAQRLSDPQLRDIPVMPAMTAWRKLNSRKQLW